MADSMTLAQLLRGPVDTPTMSNQGMSLSDLMSQSKNYLGYPIREPYPSEHAYFKQNPHIGGMATEDNRIILNPYSTLTPQEKDAVGLNEAYRLKMRESNYAPQFTVTPQQQQTFQGTPYQDNPNALRQTILARILSGDPSAKDQTFEQNVAANRLLNPFFK